MDDLDTNFGTYTGSPKKVYRLFKEKWQAECFLKGDIWLSTLEECRNYENSEQGDPNEGKQVHLVSSVSGSPAEPRIQEIARRQGIEIGTSGGGGSISISQNVHTSVHENSYLLCTSKVYNERLKDVFGQYVVEITDVYEFNSRLSFSLFDQFKIFQGMAGEVQYTKQTYLDLEPIPKREIFLIKDNRYEYQKEFRFVWRAHKPMIKPFLFSCPSLSYLCKWVPYNMVTSLG